MVGGSVFYAPDTDFLSETDAASNIQTGNVVIRTKSENSGFKELEDGKGISEVDQLERELQLGADAQALETQLSSFIWICSSTHAASVVTVIDANNPAEILSTFDVCANHLLCISSIPGAVAEDYRCLDEELAFGDGSGGGGDGAEDVGRVSYVRGDGKNVGEDGGDAERLVASKDVGLKAEDDGGCGKDDASAQDGKELGQSVAEVDDDAGVDTDVDGDGDGVKKDVVEPMSSVLSTMWLGAQSGMLYVHSSVAQWQKCLHSVCLKDAVLAIV